MTTGRVTYHPGIDALLVAFDYDPRATVAIKRIPGADYDGDGTWTIPRPMAADLHRFLVDFRLDVAPTALDVIARERANTVRLSQLSSAVTFDGNILPDVPLRDYQRAGVEYARRTRRCFIADEMGLGKTITALSVLEAEDAWPAVVVSPASLKLTWRDELAHWFPHRRSAVLQSQSPKPLDAVPADLFIINYDVLHYWVKRLLELGLKATILDEVHYCRNAGTQRIKAVKKLTLATKTGFVLGLTGTPLYLDTDNLRVQLEVIRRLDDIGGYPLFKRRYSGKENAVELHKRLRATCYLRRTKDQKDVADELPKQMPPVRLMFEGTKDGMREYAKAEADVAKWFADRAAAIALEIGEDPRSAAVAARMKAESAIHLVRIAALKRLAALAKLPSVHEWIEDFLQGGRKLVVFAHHRDVVEELATRWGGVMIQGGMTAEQRHEAVRRFQEDPEVKVIVLSLTAGGVGLTLTAASDVLFVEMGWAPAEHDQATGRCDRIGQTVAVTPYYAVCEGTFDVETYDLLGRRRAVMNAVVDGVDPESAESGGAAEVIQVFRARTGGLAA